MNETHESTDALGDDAIEARIAAWVLGESSAVEAADLEQLCEQRPELLVFRRRTEALHQLLTETESTGSADTWKLPPEKRRALDGIFDSKPSAALVKERKNSNRKSGFRVFFAIAACLLFAAVVLQITSHVADRKSFPVAFQHKDDAVSAPDMNGVTGATRISPLTAKRSDEIYGVDSMAMSKNRDLGLQEATRQRQLAGKKLVASSAEIIATGPAIADQLAASDSFVSSAPVEAEPSIMNSVAAAESIAEAKSRAAQDVISSRLRASDPASFRKIADGNSKDSSRRMAAAATDARSTDQVAAMAPASAPMLTPHSPSPVASAPRIAARKSQVESLDELFATENPYSTFPLSIGDASFQLAKAALAKGIRPDPNTIRLEQFYNAVDYGDPAPTASESVTVAINQSTHPFLPSRNLVRLALGTRSTGRNALEPLHLTLLVDQSESLVGGEHRLSMVRALNQLPEFLTKNDLISVVGFSRTSHLIADRLSGDQSAKLVDLTSHNASGNEANLEEAIKLGGEIAIRNQLAGAQNRILLFTNGSASIGSANLDQLTQQVKTLRQQGIYFDIVDTRAAGSNDRLLSELVRVGNGRHYLVGGQKPTDFASQLAGKLHPAAEHLEVQVKFNAKRIGKYKLLGFEQDRVGTEPLLTDAVDIASHTHTESGVAIYQFESLAGGSGEVGEVSVRFHDTTRGEMVSQTWEIPYQSQPVAFDRAAPSIQLAGLALFAAEKLRGGASAAFIDFHQLTGATSRVKQFYSSNPRVGEILEVIEKLMQ